MSVTRADIVATARLWIDTPWHHMGRTPHLALDCAGLLIALARHLRLVHRDFDVAAYERVPDGKAMLAICNAYMRRIKVDQAQAGDAVCLITDRHPQHLGVLAEYRHGGMALIHAANNARPARVIEHRFVHGMGMRLVAAYAFPGVD